jgi:hypothetical protein
MVDPDGKRSVSALRSRDGLNTDPTPSFFIELLTGRSHRQRDG